MTEHDHHAEIVADRQVDPTLEIAAMMGRYGEDVDHSYDLATKKLTVRGIGE